MINFLTSFWAGFLALLPTLIRIVIVLVILLVLNKAVPKVINRIWAKAHADDVVKNYVLMAARILLWVLAIFIVLDMIGFPIGSLLTVIAAVGAAVALAVKDNLANIASGIVLLFTKPFKAGDFIEVGGVSGTVREIELMRTYIDTVGNTRACVPNTQMVTATIINYSEHDFRRQDMLFSISYDSDVSRAKDVVLAAAQAHEMVLSAPEAPMVVVAEYQSSAIILMLRFWCNQGDYFTSQFSLNEKVKAALDQAGIKVPYPHVEVVGLSKGE